MPAGNIREFIDYARANPGKVNWGSLGMGSLSHLYMEWFQAWNHSM